MHVLLLALYRVLRSVLTALRQRLRFMAEARGRRGAQVLQILYYGSTIVGGVLFLRWMKEAMDPHAEAKKHAAKKVKHVEQRLGVPLNGLSSHELIAVDSILMPQSIDVELDDIGGLDDTVDDLVNQVQGPMANPDVFSSGLLRHPKGILLYGPPGTGKTMMAKALAKYCEAFFLAVQPSAIQSKWYGDTNKAIQGVFRVAHKLSEYGKPCVIFIDEVDAMLGRRRDGEHEVSIGMKNEFMSLWDGIESNSSSKVIVMGATNRPQELDEAVVRRFTLSIEVPLPDTPAREAILQRVLQLHCRRHHLGEAAAESSLLKNQPLSSLGGKRPLQWLAEHTQEYSGADLLELSTEAVRYSVRSVMFKFRAQDKSQKSSAPAQSSSQPPVTLADFQAVLKKYKPTQVKAKKFAASHKDPAAAAAMNMFASLMQSSCSNGTADSDDASPASNEDD